MCDLSSLPESRRRGRTGAGAEELVEGDGWSLVPLPVCDFETDAVSRDGFDRDVRKRERSVRVDISASTSGLSAIAVVSCV